MDNTVIKTDEILSVGIDIGSTTAKLSVYSQSLALIYKDYKRHLGSVREALAESLKNLMATFGDSYISLLMTGSAGMGIAEQYNLPFVQELIAASEYISIFHPDVKTLVDIGGEDSKIIFFKPNGNHDIRMNGNCAGGTGAFLDQMASIMNMSLEEIDALAGHSLNTYPIASRCGVFAKTDVQNLISRKIPLADIAKSIYNALSIQLCNTLLKGSKMEPVAAFSGGPLTFLPNLRRTLLSRLQIEPFQFRYIENQELITASGAAIMQNSGRYCNKISSLLEALENNIIVKNPAASEPLFKDFFEYSKWLLEKESYKAARAELVYTGEHDYFMGIDSGSTTTKIVVIDSRGRIVFDFYRNNNSDPIGAVRQGLAGLKRLAAAKNIPMKIRRSAVTGYGEDLVASAFSIDDGIVETLAHYRAAKVFDERVSFILDIGGQDMKAIFVKGGVIRNIEINEACSSGCGSFIENFANSLNYSVDKFSRLACSASSPSDLGTRCTVFMNSKVKQAFREGSEIKDISAGLALSVINNCLHKVLKIHDKSALGDSIIVQGGTFRNPSIHKAFEKIIGRKVICPDISELMGAFGAALTAFDRYNIAGSMGVASRYIEDIANTGDYTVKLSVCNGCENVCKVSVLVFENGNRFFTGNQCEKVFSNKGSVVKKGFNFPQYKYELLFTRETKPAVNNSFRQKIGIPRVLNFYDNYPFWNTLFRECGFEIVLSDRSSRELYEKGSGYLMSDNICFPAKIVHGHILNLIEKGVDRIFYPITTHAFDDEPDSNNCFNCPIVTGYPDVVRNTVHPGQLSNISLDTPNINFKNIRLLEKASYKYFMQLGIRKGEFKKAFEIALKEQSRFKEELNSVAGTIIGQCNADDSKMIVLAGRPYHIDPMLNQNIPEIITGFGIPVLTEDCLPEENINLGGIGVITQWAYPNRIFKAAKWAAGNENTELVMINSFGCGPDTIVTDEIKEILESEGRNFTLIRVDELNSSASLKLRIRSMVESIKAGKKDSHSGQNTRRVTTKPFETEDRARKILVPYFSPFHVAYIAGTFNSMGYNIEILPPSDRESIEIGLKYVNNEICYPATIVIGDILKALLSGRYDTRGIAAGLTQTGGQCRASNYIPLLKKALVKAGFQDVPVVAVTLARGGLNHQPGFTIDKNSLVLQGIKGLLFCDSLASLYYSTAPREKYKGSSLALVNKFNALLLENDGKLNTDYLVYMLEDAVDHFNNIETNDGNIPKIGVVGEVFVKNNPFGNNFIVDRLVQSGYEIIMPPLINMFIQWFVNAGVKNELNIEESKFKYYLAKITELYYNRLHSRFEAAGKLSRYYFRHPSIREIASRAEKIINMASHYFGEGWMIAGDIAWMYENGIRNIVCLQPFGCLANHIVAKGLEKKLKEQLPDLNIAFLDIDYGSSDVNLQNRLHLLMNRVNTKEKIEFVF